MQVIDRQSAEWKKYLVNHPKLIAMKAIGMLMSSLDHNFTAGELRERLMEVYLGNKCEMNFMHASTHFSTDITSYLKDNGLILVKDKSNQTEKKERVAIFFPTAKAIVLQIDFMNKVNERIKRNLETPQYGAFNFIPDIVRSFENEIENLYHDVERTLGFHNYLNKNVQKRARLGIETFALLVFLSYKPVLGQYITDIQSCRYEKGELENFNIIIRLRPSEHTKDLDVEEIKNYYKKIDFKGESGGYSFDIMFKPASEMGSNNDIFLIKYSKTGTRQALRESVTSDISQSN